MLPDASARFEERSRSPQWSRRDHTSHRSAGVASVECCHSPERARSKRSNNRAVSVQNSPLSDKARNLRVDTQKLWDRLRSTSAEAAFRGDRKSVHVAMGRVDAALRPLNTVAVMNKAQT